MPIKIKGQPTSQEVRERLAEAGEIVILSFSCGADSTAAWIALHDAGVPVLPVYLYGVPGLKFVEEELAYFEDYFRQRIVRLPDPSLYRMLMNKVFQPPDRLRTIEDSNMAEPDYAQVLDEVRRDYDLPGAWAADGVRATDSPVRRAAMVRHGIMREGTRKVSVIADWRVSEVRGCLAEHGVFRTPDYGIWGRSFEGISYDSMRGLRDNYPDDYETVLRWFPLADLELLRADEYGV